MPFPMTCRWLRSAALHRIQFRTCCFVPMSYFYSETNQWLQIWAKRWALLWSAITSGLFHLNFHFTWKKLWLVTAWHLQSIKTFLTVELSQYHKRGSTFSSSKQVAACSDCQYPVFVLASLPAQAVAERCPKSLANNFAVKSFDSLVDLNSFREWLALIARQLAQVGRGLNLDSNLNIVAWPMGCTLVVDNIEDFSALKPQYKVQWTVWSFNSF